MRNRILLTLTLLLCLGLFLSSGVGQESTYLSQKLMLEQDLRSRIESALSKILDDQRYVLDVTVDLKFTPTIKEEVTYRPSEERPVGVATEEESSREREKVPSREEPTSRYTGLPIPGFEFRDYDEGKPVVETSPEEPTTAPATPAEEAKILTQSYTDIKSSVPEISQMEISCILPEGSAPELIENVRQIIMVASRFDRSRGDVLSIMTASFKERKDEKTAEAVILRTIAHKIDSLENAQTTEATTEGSMLMEEWLRWQEEERSRREEEMNILASELAALRDKLEEKEAAAEISEEEIQLARMDEYAKQISMLQTRLDSLQVIASQEQEKAEELSQVDLTPQELAAAPVQEEVSGGIDNLPIYLMSAISLLAVIALAAVIIFNGRSKPKYVMPPPWMMPPPKKKKVKKTKKSKKESGDQEEEQALATPAPPPAPSQPPQPAMETEEDTAVMQSEIKSARQSVVSMSVGQPDTATSIVREWLEQEAPPPPEPAQTAEAGPAEPEAAAEDEKGKKKKKKKK